MRIVSPEVTSPIDGTSYELPINNGPNSLHGGLKGFNAVIWDGEELDPNKVAFTYTSPDGEEGYPGQLTVRVVYTLTDEGELCIEYEATTTRPTVVNLTNTPTSTSPAKAILRYTTTP